MIHPSSQLPAAGSGREPPGGDGDQHRSGERGGSGLSFMRRGFVCAFHPWNRWRSITGPRHHGFSLGLVMCSPCVSACLDLERIDLDSGSCCLERVEYCGYCARKKTQTDSMVPTLTLKSIFALLGNRLMWKEQPGFGWLDASPRSPSTLPPVLIVQGEDLVRLLEWCGLRMRRSPSSRTCVRGDRQIFSLSAI